MDGPCNLCYCPWGRDRAESIPLTLTVFTQGRKHHHSLGIYTSSTVGISCGLVTIDGAPSPKNRNTEVLGA